MLNFFPPPKKSKISITVTIPKTLPEPGSAIGNLLNSCSIITLAVSLILLVGGIEITSLLAIAMISPSLLETFVSCSTEPIFIDFLKMDDLSFILSHL